MKRLMRKKLGQIIRLCLELLMINKQVAFFFGWIKNLGYRYVTKSGYSLGMDDFPTIIEKPAIVGGIR